MGKQIGQSVNSASLLAPVMTTTLFLIPCITGLLSTFRFHISSAVICLPDYRARSLPSKKIVANAAARGGF
jgi:hypothetical protein